MSAVVSAVRYENAFRRRGNERHNWLFKLVDLKIERVPVGDWEDVTAEFVKGDE